MSGSKNEISLGSQDLESNLSARYSASKRQAYLYIEEKTDARMVLGCKRNQIEPVMSRDYHEICR